MKASFGHVRDFTEKEIGIEPPDFKPHYRLLAMQADQGPQVKQSAQQADAIYLGTAPDREGEAIASRNSIEPKKPQLPSLNSE